jgi:hypothetical protein
MDKILQEKVELKDRLISIYKKNKFKIYLFLGVILISIILFFSYEINKKRNNNLMAEKYIEAGLYLNMNEKEKSLKLYQEIILSENKFYSILALNTIVEKKLITDKKKILDYFSFLENVISKKENKDLIMFKKAIYLIKTSDIQSGKNLLKNLVDNNSLLKSLALEILEK